MVHIDLFGVQFRNTVIRRIDLLADKLLTISFILYDLIVGSYYLHQYICHDKRDGSGWFKLFMALLLLSAALSLMFA